MKEVWLTLNLSAYLARFIASFAKCSRFCFVEIWSISFGMGGTESKSADITISLFK